MNHWSDTRWASWGVVLLILASLLMFGALGCQRPTFYARTFWIKRGYNPTMSGITRWGCSVEVANGDVYLWPTRKDGSCVAADGPK